MLPRVASLYKGVVGAASGAGIYIGTYFAFYGAACNVLSRRTDLSPGGVAFVAGGIAAAGGSVVKVPLAVCIRSVQVADRNFEQSPFTCFILQELGTEAQANGWCMVLLSSLF